MVVSTRVRHPASNAFCRREPATRDRGPSAARCEGMAGCQLARPFVLRAPRDGPTAPVGGATLEWATVCFQTENSIVPGAGRVHARVERDDTRGRLERF